jgi:hypothetical protein
MRIAFVATLVGVLAVAAGLALASSGVPAPTITSHPVSPTNSTSASLSFTDTQSKVTFVCSLDGPSYSACTSPKTYSGLTAGTHTFHVEAKDTSGHTSEPASFTWTIDLTPPPAPAISAKPPSLSNSTSASFSFTDTEAGVSFVCKLDGGAPAACSSPKAYSGLSQGSHTFQVQARDAAGNLSGPASWTWTVDTVPPPNPTITSDPPNPSTSTSATFTFTDSEAGVSFSCRLDSGTWTACTSPATYNGLNANNSHEFSVRAVDAAGNQSGETDFIWKISANVNFTISGNAPNLLYPGAPAVSIPVKLTNPNSVPIYITSLKASLLTTGLPAGCESAWFQIAQSNISATQTVLVPANNGSATLPTQGATTPTIQMIDSHTTQNACRGANLTFSYSGSAHS